MSDSPPVFHAFIDESGKDGASEKFVIGALGVHGEEIRECSKWLVDQKRKFGLPDDRELHFSGLNPIYKNQTIGFMEMICGQILVGNMSFSAVVYPIADCRHKDHSRKFAENLSVQYQVYFRNAFSKRIEPGSLVRFIMDENSGVPCLKTLERCVNQGIAKRHGGQAPYAIELFESTSKSTILLQVSDMLTGIVAFRNNPKRSDLTKPKAQAKLEVARSVERALGVNSLSVNTPWRMIDFNVWHYNKSLEKPRSQI